MAKRTAAKLPTPTQAISSTLPKSGNGSYAAITRAADRYLAKAEEAIRMASCLWADIDGGLERQMEGLAQEVLTVRQESVTHVADLYGDRLNEAAL